MNGIDQLMMCWQEASAAGAAAAGGKGWNLGRMAGYGFPVPAGGVLSANAYHNFLAHNGLLHNLDELEREVTAANVTGKASEELLAGFREQIISGTIPPAAAAAISSFLAGPDLRGKPLAVRSSASLEDSAAASFAGIHASYLNVRGENAVFEAVKKCYASLWTVTAVSYRRKMDIADHLLQPAVVIMAMVEAESAGIGFTCDPRTGRQDVVLINANFGLGESVVGGRVEPDEYRLDARGFMPGLLERCIGSKEGRTVPLPGGGTVFINNDANSREAGKTWVLPDERVIELALLLERVYESLGEGEQHQDVEWAFDGRHFHLLQARPVTSLPRYTYPVLRGQPDYWSNANVRDALPMVQCTLNRKLVNSLFNTIVPTPFRSAGYPLLPGLQYSRFYNGRMYMNVSLIQWEFYDAFGITPAETNQAAGGYQPEISINENKEDQKIADRQRNSRKLRLGLAILQTRKTAAGEYNSMQNYASRWRETDLAGMSNGELLQAIIDIHARTIAYAPTAGMLNSALGLPFFILVRVLEKRYPGRGHAVANALMLGRGNITSAEQGYRLFELAEKARQEPDARRFLAAGDFKAWENALPEGSHFKNSFLSYLDEYGHRAVYEGDLSNPRWREDPSYLLQMAAAFMENADFKKLKEVQREKSSAAWQKIRRELSWPGFILTRWLVKQAVRGAEMRESAKSELVRPAELIRAASLEAGRRLVEQNILQRREDVFYCSWPDLVSILAGHWDGRGLAGLVKERAAKQKEMEALPIPDLIVDDSPQIDNLCSQNTACTGGGELTGTGVAAGRASGPARLVCHPGEGERMQPGEILVAPSTDPGWTPLFLKASALVMETGGSLSHGAIVAREFGVPAVVNIPGVMGIIKDGQTITVDGTEGKVYI